MLDTKGKEYNDGIDLLKIFTARDNQPTVRKYLFPAEYYDHDTGDTLYLLMSPVELPFRAVNAVADMYYHVTGTKHKHSDR
ncbi:MAG: hypothetical protein KJ601_06775 [Nanoarchaeota archaeon]|nr:hypothetical protein [Nanoarchaeota archaeon]